MSQKSAQEFDTIRLDLMARMTVESDKEFRGGSLLLRKA